MPAAEHAGRGFHLDHVTPLSKGGAHMLENLVLCCDRCNWAKWDSSAEEYGTWLQGVAKRLRPLESTKPMFHNFTYGT
ncbi:HNH endonuclease [Deinococcus petrolearius]|uniref:HNH endonuclease n=1 Tax=Deinococcus petrolearius TaxID=1751295 RepID=A0ABW1DI80_9DEIO